MRKDKYVTVCCSSQLRFFHVARVAHFSCSTFPPPPFPPRVLDIFSRLSYLQPRSRKYLHIWHHRLLPLQLLLTSCCDTDTDRLRASRWRILFFYFFIYIFIYLFMFCACSGGKASRLVSSENLCLLNGASEKPAEKPLHRLWEYFHLHCGWQTRLTLLMHQPQPCCAGCGSLGLAIIWMSLYTRLQSAHEIQKQLLRVGKKPWRKNGRKVQL